MPGRRILLVEGTDDEHVIKHICSIWGVPPLSEIKAHGGVEQLLESFPVRLKASEAGDIVGLVVDADTDCISRWQSVQSHLARLRYPNVPSRPAPDGTILVPPDGTLLPRVGVWIMPDNQTSGILEDFLAFLIPPESVLFEHVKSSVASIPQGERRFIDLAEPKAIIHTWLAWQEQPGRPFGIAITAGYLEPRAEQVDALVAWLNRLFFS